MVRNTLAGVVAMVLMLGCAEPDDPRFNEVAKVEVFSSVGYTVAVGGTLQLEGRAVTWAGTRVDERVTSWTTSNAAIATVTNTGLVTGKAVGSALISAHADGVASAGRLINVSFAGMGPG